MNVKMPALAAAVTAGAVVAHDQFLVRHFPPRKREAADRVAAQGLAIAGAGVAALGLVGAVKGSAARRAIVGGAAAMAGAGAGKEISDHTRRRDTRSAPSETISEAASKVPFVVARTGEIAFAGAVISTIALRGSKGFVRSAALGAGPAAVGSLVAYHSYTQPANDLRPFERDARP